MNDLQSKAYNDVKIHLEKSKFFKWKDVSIKEISEECFFVYAIREYEKCFPSILLNKKMHVAVIYSDGEIVYTSQGQL